MCVSVGPSVPLFSCELTLALSLKPWLRRFPAALTEPRGGMSLPAVDTLAVGPGSLWEPEVETKEDLVKVNRHAKKPNTQASVGGGLSCFLTATS